MHQAAPYSAALFNCTIVLLVSNNYLSFAHRLCTWPRKLKTAIFRSRETNDESGEENTNLYCRFSRRQTKYRFCNYMHVIKNRVTTRKIFPQLHFLALNNISRTSRRSDYISFSEFIAKISRKRWVERRVKGRLQNLIWKTTRCFVDENQVPRFLADFQHELDRSTSSRRIERSVQRLKGGFYRNMPAYCALSRTWGGFIDSQLFCLEKVRMRFPRDVGKGARGRVRGIILPDFFPLCFEMRKTYFRRV